MMITQLVKKFSSFYANLRFINKVRFKDLFVASMKITALWDAMLCSQVVVYMCFKVLAASIIRAISQHTPLECWLTCTRLHSATSQKTVTFIPKQIHTRTSSGSYPEPFESSLHPHTVSFRTIVILSCNIHLDPIRGLSNSDILTKILYAFLKTTTHTTCPSHCIFFI
jgi:hypothetical protein